MDNNYIKDILTEYQYKLKTVQAVLELSGVFPDKNNPVRKLTSIQEFILKTTYLLKINFLEETAVLFAFAYSKEQVEKNVLELEHQGYLRSEVSPEYGKAFTLTRQALYFIKHHPDYSREKKEYQELSINEDIIPKETGLIRYKITASYFSQQIFYSRLQQGIHSFRGMGKEERQTYSRIQYIRYFLYKEFLTWDNPTKTEYLLQMGFSEEISNRYGSTSFFSTTFSKCFAEQYLITFGADSMEENPAYQIFRGKINTKMKQSVIKGDFLFHFLKDFINETQEDKEQVLTGIFKALQLTITNVLRDRDMMFRNSLIACSSNKDMLTRERALYLYKEKERILSMSRRNLIKTNAFQKGLTEQELVKATEQLNLIEIELDTTIKIIQRLEDDFLLPLYETIHMDKINNPKEKVLTFQQLKSAGVYVAGIKKGTDKKILTFLIVSSTKEAIDLMALFQRLEKIWVFYYRFLLEYDFQIHILCYGEQRTKQTQKTFQKAMEWIGDIREYQLFHLLLTERTIITDCEFHLKQRYEVYRELSEQKKATP